MGSTRLPKGKRNGKTSGQMKKSDMLKLASAEVYAREMVTIATNVTLFSLLLSIRDEFSFGRSRLERLMKRFENNVHCLKEERITIEDIIETLKEELGSDFLEAINVL